MAQINHDTAGLWDGWQQRELRIARCGDCGTWIHPPRGLCPECWSDNVAAEVVDGAGRLVTYSLPRVGPGATGPVITGVVTLSEAEGVRMLTRIVGCSPGEVAIGMPLTLEWRDQDGAVVPGFRPAAADPGRPSGSPPSPPSPGSPSPAGGTA